jgi:hypothetical protein
MILIDKSDIGTVSTDQFIKQKMSCLKQLNFELSFDLILDCTKTLLPIEDLIELQSLLKKKSRLLVLILPHDEIDILPIEFNIAPTLEEANDFISFERMQRDLGFQ